MKEHSKVESCWSLFRWDQLRLGQLSESDAGQGREHLHQCSHCRARWQALETEREKFESSAIPHWIKNIRASKKRGAKLRNAWGGWNPTRLAFTFSALILLIVILFPGKNQISEELSRDSQPNSAWTPVVRSKGADSFGAYIKHEHSVRLARDGDLVHPGDALRFFYRTRHTGFFVIANIDGKNQVSAFYPHGPDMAKVEVGSQKLLPESTVLDSTLGAEQLYGIFCQKNRTVAEILDVLRRDDEVRDWPNDCQVQRIELQKEQEPAQKPDQKPVQELAP